MCIRDSQSLGDGQKVVYASEEAPVVKMGKKLVAARDLPAGHVVTEADIAIKSPGDGIPPAQMDRAVGKSTTEAMTRDSAFSLDILR